MTAHAVPAWYRNLPLLVLSTLMLLLGLFFLVAVLNLPPPQTDHLHGPVRWVVAGFMVMSFGLGGGTFEWSLIDRFSVRSGILLAVGVAAMLPTLYYSIVLHPSSPW